MTQQMAAGKVKRSIRNLSNLKSELALAKSELGLAIRKWRIASDISMEEFAETNKVSRPFLSMMESGKRPVPKQFIELFE